MAIQHYTEEDIAKLREGGRLLAEILGELATMAKPGVTTAELDAHAEKRMRDAGGAPSFKGYKAGGSVPFNGTVCTSINEEVVHAPPHPGRVLQSGMLLSLDIGVRKPEVAAYKAAVDLLGVAALVAAGRAVAEAVVRPTSTTCGAT